ncbi:MAG: serine/threonine-protein phosphatase [Thermoanaerobaculia bacterium]|nr:serine/threonine-protein phosphatase [Thermoanaerobaculia bacterium]
MSTPQSNFPLRVGAKSDPGKVRSENQDRISRFLAPFGEVFVVADGMGGHQDGGKAAEMTILGLEQHLNNLRDMTPGGALAEAGRRTNHDILQASRAAGRKMGATMALVLLEGRRVWVAHVGDSRAYLFRGGALTRLTVDHTLVQQMVDHQMITEEEARQHPDGNVVTRGFGHADELAVDVREPFEVVAGDRLMLCSDGLSGYVGDGEIEGALRATENAQEATDRLVDLALRAGGEDNVSVQLVQFLEERSSRANVLAPAAGSASVGQRSHKIRLEKSLLRDWRFVLVMLLAFVLGAAAILWVLRAIDRSQGKNQPAASTATEPKRSSGTGKKPGASAAHAEGAGTDARQPVLRLLLLHETGQEKSAEDRQKEFAKLFPNVEIELRPLDSATQDVFETGVLYFAPATQPASEAGRDGDPAAPGSGSTTGGMLYLRLGDAAPPPPDEPPEDGSDMETSPQTTASIASAKIREERHEQGLSTL